MYTMYMLAPVVEQACGSRRFLTIYMLSAISGNVLQYAMSPLYGLSMGASCESFRLTPGILHACFIVNSIAQAQVLDTRCMRAHMMEWRLRHTHACTTIQAVRTVYPRSTQSR